MRIHKTLPGLKDVLDGLHRYPLVLMLGWQDIRERYQRSVLGPFWLTISMGVMIVSIGFVFGHLSNSPMEEFLPFLTIGLILWAYMSAIVSDGCLSFMSAEQIIKQLPMPLFIHVLRVIWRNTLILFHNFLIFPIVLLVFDRTLEIIALQAIGGLILLVMNLAWVSLLLGILCTRYRDLAQMVNSLLQVTFYLTPIIWMPSLLPDRAGIYLLDLNPIYHLLAIVREPLLGHSPTALNWLVSVFMAIIGWVSTLLFYGRYKRRIAYWL